MTIEAASTPGCRASASLQAFRARKGSSSALTFGFDPTSTTTGEERHNAPHRCSSAPGTTARGGRRAPGHAERLAFARDPRPHRRPGQSGSRPRASPVSPTGPTGSGGHSRHRDRFPDLVRAGTTPYLVPLVSAPGRRGGLRRLRRARARRDLRAPLRPAHEGRRPCSRSSHAGTVTARRGRSLQPRAAHRRACVLKASRPNLGRPRAADPECTLRAPRPCG